MKLRNTLLASLLLFVSVPCAAVELQAGVIYPPGTRVESAQLGVALTLPQGWRGVLPQGSELFVLESSDQQTRLYLRIEAIGQAQMVEALSAQIPLGGGVVLSPTSQPSVKNGLIEAHFNALLIDRSEPAVVVAREIRVGLSAAIILLPAADDARLKTLAADMLNIIESHAIAQQAVGASPSQGPGSWQEYLRGRHIQRYNTHSNYQEIQNLWLCSDGSFRKTFQSGGFSMYSASGATQSGSQGRWQAQGDSSGEGSLTLQFADGGSASHRLALKDKLYLDGKQWLRVKNEYCQ
jgi:hypothetical protein